MADQKLTQITNIIASYVGTDLLYGVTDPAGSPASGKMTFSTLFGKVPVAPLPSAAAGVDVGSALLPWKDIYFAGSSGTPAANNFKLTGASTGGLRTITFPDASGTVTLGGNSFTGTGDVVRATSPTLTTPTIASFVNAGHNHQDAAGGGQLALAAFSSTTGTGAVVGASSPTLTTPTISGAISFPDNVRQTFNPGANAAGLNVGSVAGDPDTPSNGDLWYDSTANELTARINGASVALGAGGSLTIGTSAIASGTATRLLYETSGNVLGEISGATSDGTSMTLTSPTINGGTNAKIFSSTGYSLTGADATNGIDLAGTWNTSGAPTAIKLNITNTASGAASLLADLQVGGSSRFSVGKLGETLITVPTTGDRHFTAAVSGTTAKSAFGVDVVSAARQLAYVGANDYIGASHTHTRFDTSIVGMAIVLDNQASSEVSETTIVNVSSAGTVSSPIGFRGGTGSGVVLITTGLLGWCASATSVGGGVNQPFDTSFGRNANGIAELNNGTPGQWGSLKLGVRNATLDALGDGLIAGRQASSGTPDVGFGSALLFRGQSSTTDNQDMARIGAPWTVATHASRTAKLVFQLTNNALALAQFAELTVTDLNLASGLVYKINGTQVLGAQGAAVADASGGAVIDAEARTALNTLLARLRTHGVIAT